MQLTMSTPELQVTTHFSFLRGASSPEELFSAASLLGIPALGVTDHGSLAGMVRAHQAAKVTGVRLVVGCRLDLDDLSSPLLVYPTDRAAYGRLCRLLSLGKARGGKGRCRLTWRRHRLVISTPSKRSCFVMPWSPPCHGMRLLCCHADPYRPLHPHFPGR